MIIIPKNSIESDIQLLELADGIKDGLVNSGSSLYLVDCIRYSCKIGVDLYIAQIIFQEAKRVVTEMGKASVVVPDVSPVF